MSSPTALEPRVTVQAVPTLSFTGNTPPSVLACTIAILLFQAISTTLVVLRVIVRLTRARHFYLNDYLVLLAFLLASAYTACSMAFFFQGVAAHHLIELLELAPERFPISIKLGVTIEFCWAIGIAFVKLSLLHLYVQLFGSDRRFLCQAGTLAFFVVVVGALAVSFVASNCRPFSANWTFTGHCVSFRPSYLTTAVLNLVLDLLILALPIPKLWHLNMATSRKVGMTFIFGIGFFICGISAWRLQVIADYDWYDLTYQVQMLTLTTGLELLLGISIACIPIIHPLLRDFLAFFLSLTSRLTYWTTNRKATNIPSANPSSSESNPSLPKTRPSESQLEKKNFKKLYNHLYPMTDLDMRSQSITTAIGESSSTSKLHPGANNELGDVEVIKEWVVQYSGDQV